MYKKPIIDLYIEELDVFSNLDLYIKELDVSSNLDFQLEEIAVDINIETAGGNGSDIKFISVNGEKQDPDVRGNIDLTIPEYEAGNGISINNYTIQLSNLTLDCGTSTTVL